MNLPSREEITVDDTLDERTACEHFFGKSLNEAEALFRAASIVYQEDLLFMGPAAFRYYVAAAIRYVQSDAAGDDSDIIHCLAGIFENRLQWEPDELRAIAPQLASACRYIVSHYDRFDLTPEIYGDLRPRFEALEQAFQRL